MADLLQRLTSGEILLSDGAMGTALQKRGLTPDQCPDSWNLTHPDDVRETIAEYAQAGSDLVETNTFGGTRLKLEKYGLGARVIELNRQAVQIARDAVQGKCQVLGSIGPTGVFLQPLGDTSEQELCQAFQQQVQGLVAGGVDALCIETMTDLNEAKTALRAAKENSSLPVIVTLTLDKVGDGKYRTMMGVSPEDIARELPAAGADIIGSNCGNGIENMVEICSQLRQQTDCFIMIQSNAGLPVLENGQTVFKATPKDMAQHVESLISAGANIIGGCCGTTPAHIAAFRQIIDKHHS
jgi:5-methyltetrahydrofolate--homocysteine methyltransferase